MALLRRLRVVERLAGIFEIGAAVLAVRNRGRDRRGARRGRSGWRCCALRAAGRCAGGGRERRREPHAAPAPTAGPAFGEVPRAELEQAVKVAARDDQSPVHVEFAERQRRIDHQPPFRPAIGELHAKERALAVAERLGHAVGGLHFEATLANKLPQISLESRTHNPLLASLDWARWSRPRQSSLPSLRQVTESSEAISSAKIAPPGFRRLKGPQYASCFGPIRATMSAAVPLSPNLR